MLNEFFNPNIYLLYINNGTFKHADLLSMQNIRDVMYHSVTDQLAQGVCKSNHIMGGLVY